MAIRQSTLKFDRKEMIHLLYIAGIQHFDPLCRDRLLNWLKKLEKSHDNPPLFIAVEWDENIFRKIAQQRPTLQHLAKKVWPQASLFFLEKLSEAMAFEADTHIESFPTVPTLWLENGRIVSPEIIENYARDRLNVYRSFLSHEITGLNNDALQIMSKEAWNCSSKPSKGNSRDIKFAKLISDHFNQLGNCWAIAIVGANHVSTVSEYMRSILIEQGIKCDVTILNPK